MSDTLRPIFDAIAPLDCTWVERARAHQLQLTKPPGSLGRLEDVACQLSGIQHRLPPLATRRRVMVFAADHGVAATRGVSPYPQEVTGQMVANFVAGGAAINALAGSVGADLRVVDVGVAMPIVQEASGLTVARVRSGSRDFVDEAAMTAEEFAAALGAGLEAAERCHADGVQVVAVGEMGIGNTTAAAAVTAALTGRAPEAVTGRGTGADDATLARKVEVITSALRRHDAASLTPLEVLRTVGGLELAAICGFTAGAARHGIAVVADGYIATAGVAVAAAACPKIRDYLFAGHRSAEPGHMALLERLGLDPLLDLGLRLGEGTGAALALGLVHAAAKATGEMATFEGAGVDDRVDCT